MAMRKLRHEEIPRIDPDAARSLPRHPVRLLLDNLRSVHNVGSIFRTSDAAGIERIYCTGITPTPEHPAIHRTALGAQDVVPWQQARDVVAILKSLRQEGCRLAAVEITDQPTAIDELRLDDFPLCLIVGNEVDGVSETALSACDLALEIPQYGTKQSINVSVACGIVLFDVVRRYRRLRSLDS